MRKLVTLFLLIVTVGMIFGGTASAALSVNITVKDANDKLVNVTKPGTHVWIEVVAATNNETVKVPRALIQTEQFDYGLKYDDKTALMVFSDGSGIYNSDPWHGGFLYLIDQNRAVWSMPGNMFPDDVVKLILPAVVTSTGYITTDVIFGDDMTNGVPSVKDSYTFQSGGEVGELGELGAPKPYHGQSIPMQSTGAPLALAALALLSIVGGSVYGKLR